MENVVDFYDSKVKVAIGTDHGGFEMKKDLCIMNPGSIGYYPNSWGCIEINPRGEIMMSHGALL